MPTAEIDGSLLNTFNPYLCLQNYPRSRKHRFGALKDGGYVVALPSIPTPWDLYISAGVGQDESFSQDFINYYALPKPQCWAFDGTITQFPRNYLPRPPRGIWWVKKNIGPHMTETTVNLGRLIAAHSNIFLKMDIEGAEYAWFLSLAAEQLAHFREIVVEFHNINTEPSAPAVFALLQSSHNLVHVHANNYGGVDSTTGIPNVIEVVWIRKDDPAFLVTDDMPPSPPLPILIPIDYPNDPDRPDIQEWAT